MKWAVVYQVQQILPTPQWFYGPSSLEIFRWTCLVGTSWCNSVSVIPQSPLPHSHWDMDGMSGEWAAEVSGQACFLKCPTFVKSTACPSAVTDVELFSPSENLPVKMRSYFSQGRKPKPKQNTRNPKTNQPNNPSNQANKKPTNKWLALYLLFFLTSFTYS